MNYVSWCRSEQCSKSAVLFKAGETLKLEFALVWDRSTHGMPDSGSPAWPLVDGSL